MRYWDPRVSHLSFSSPQYQFRGMASRALGAVLAVLCSVVGSFGHPVVGSSAPGVPPRATHDADPRIRLSTYVGALDTFTSQDITTAVCTDRRGNVYLAGIGSPAAILPDVTHTIGTGDGNPWLAKLDARGEVVFLTTLGGSRRDWIWDLAVDDAENLYVIGNTESSDFPVIAPPTPTAPSSPVHHFISKVRPDGSGLVYSTIFPFTVNDALPAIAVGRDGTVAFVTMAGRGIPPLLVNPIDTTLAYQKALVGKIDAAGTAFEFVTLLGGEPMAYPTDVAIDGAGSVYVTGWVANGNDFPVFNPALDVPPSTSFRGFVTKYAADGSALAYSTLVAGRGTARAYGIAVDESGSAYVVGTAGPSFPITHDLDPDGPDGTIAYVLKLDPAGGRVVYSTAVAHGGDVALRRVAVDAFGNVTAAGVTTDPDLRLVRPLQDHLGSPPTQPATDVYLAKVSSSGTSLQLSSYYGGAGDEFVTQVAVDLIGTVWVSGRTSSDDFPLVAPFEAYPGNDVELDYNGTVMAFMPIKPPVVRSVKIIDRGNKPFSVRVKGSEMPPGTRVYIGDDTDSWSNTTSTGSGLILRGGDALAVRFPPGVPVTMRILNPDGSGVVTTVTR